MKIIIKILNIYKWTLAERLIELKSRFDITDVQRSFAFFKRKKGRRYSVAQKEDEPATDDSAATVVVDYAGFKKCSS